jgi:ADP-heptose:LPS heptosyltransferase
MHIVLPLDADCSLGPIHLTKHVHYLCEDVNAGELLAQCDNVRLKAKPWTPFHGPWPAHDLLVVLPGGYGDLLFLTPVLVKLRQMAPLRKLYVSCLEPGRVIIEDFATWLPYPLNMHAQEVIDSHIVALEMLVQRNPGEHPTDLFARALDIPDSDDSWSRACLYRVKEDEAQWAAETFPRSHKRRVGIQVKASALCRSYPPHMTTELMSLLNKRDCEVFLFGAPGEVAGDDYAGRVTNLTTKNLSFRQSCAVLATCDGVIAPDSSLCHVAGAFRLPTVALYGPFKWVERTKYHPTIHGINGHAPCAPCHHHVRALRGNQWPADGPCRKSGQCEALANIEPRRVVSKLLDLMPTSPKPTL